MFPTTLYRRLQRALPAAESRLAAMQQMADEFNTLAQGRPKDSAGAKAPTPANLLITAMKAKGLTLEALPTGSAQIVLKGTVGFDDWVDWLAGAATQGWRVERASVQREPSSTGQVKVEATLVMVIE